MARPSFGTSVRTGRWLLPALAFLLAGCDSSDGPSPANAPPTVRLTAGPMDGDSAAYNASFHWYGYDPDGYVARYQYALDVPPELLEAVHDPASTAIPWHDTVELEGRFPFTTPNADSTTGPGGQRIPLPRYSGSHNLFIRAVDNQGAISPPDYVSFTALNVAPRTLIEGGKYVGEELVILDGRCALNLRWEGEDPDEFSAGSGPVRYEWKLKQMPLTWNPIGHDMQHLVTVEAADVEWTRIGPDTTELDLTFATGFAYILAIRAVDAEGAREDLFLRGRNALLVHPATSIAVPKLSVRDARWGEAEFGGPEVRWDVPLGEPIQLEIRLEGYPLFPDHPVEFEVCLGDADPDQSCAMVHDRGTGSPWLAAPLVFAAPGDYSVRVTARYSCAAVVVGLINVRVIEMTREKPVLYVDDFRRSQLQGVTDALMDERVRSMLVAAGIPADQIDQWDTFGPGDLMAVPVIPQLADLAPYRLVVWSVHGSGTSRNPALVYATACPGNNSLRSYLQGGGSAWIFGQQTFGALDRATGASCLANLNYALGESPTGLNFGPGDFLFDFMSIAGGEFYDVRSNLPTHGLVGTDPTPEAGTEGFPPLEVDHGFWPTEGPLPFCDAMFEPIFDATGGLDTLYTYVAGRSISTINRKPTAFRYADPDPVPDHGPLAVFGFPGEYLQPGSVESGTGTHAMAATLIDWFRRHERPAGR